jgi:PKHD-type hydroxylase
MLICIPQLLDKSEVAAMRKLMAAAEWIDGRATTGAQAVSVKDNRQIPQGSEIGGKLADLVVDAVGRSQLFLSASMPARILPPMFSSYTAGQKFGIHVDNAIRAVPGSAVRIRTDLSCTLFLSEPEEYDGGELEIETRFGAQAVKLPAGDAVLYPSTSLHRVTEIARGERLVSFFWIQSMIRDEENRTLLFELDQAVQEYGWKQGLADDHAVRLTGIYHNLVRRWAET